MDFNFSNIEAPKKLNRDFILSKISDAMIFGYYFGKFDLKSVYPSKFHKDNSPSTGFYISKSGKIIYNHLNDKEPKLDAFSFVMRLYHCSFSDAIKKIATDFGLVSGEINSMAGNVIKNLANFDKSHKKSTKIHFKPKSFDSEARAFWSPYHITRDELKRENIYQIDKLYINEIFIPNHSNCLRFALTVPNKDEMLVKVYSPGDNDGLKWVSNIPLDLPFGLEDIKKPGKRSFTSKAQKDRIIIKKFLPVVLASQNESIAAMSSSLLKKLGFFYQENWVGWDNDETGLFAMQELIAKDICKDSFKSIHVPIEYAKEGIKDFSDLAKEKGLKAIEKLLKENELI